MLNSAAETQYYQKSIITVLNLFRSLINSHLTKETLIPMKTINSNPRRTFFYNVSDSDSDSDNYTKESTIIWTTENLNRIELQKSSWNKLCDQADEEVSHLKTSSLKHLATLIVHMKETHSRLPVQYAFALSKLIDQRHKKTSTDNEIKNLLQSIGQLKLESFESYNLAINLYKSQLNLEQHLLLNSLHMDPYQERPEEISEMRLHPLVNEFIKLAINPKAKPAAQAIKDIIHPQSAPTNNHHSLIRGSIELQPMVQPTVSLSGLLIIHPGYVLNQLKKRSRNSGKSLIHELIIQHNSPEYNPSRAFQIYKSSEIRDSRYFIFDKAIVHVTTGGKGSGIVQYYTTDSIDNPIFEFEVERYKKFGLTIDDLFPLDNLECHINSISMTLTAIEKDVKTVLNWRIALVFMLLILNKTGANPTFLALMKNINCPKNLDQTLDPNTLLTHIHNFLLTDTDHLPADHILRIAAHENSTSADEPQKQAEYLKIS